MVLSTYNTGGAYQARGESLSDLARAFFFAGSRSLLVSHWSVHDEATAELMILVFDSLKNNPSASIAEALTMAQLEMLNHPKRKNWVHPYYWAGFSLVGDGKLRITTDSWSASR